MHNKLILGIAGGTGSGKTTIAEKIYEHFKTRAVYIPHDRYYKDQSAKSMEERVKTNYDHPDALETELFISHLQDLQKGNTIEVPEYDFTQHTRKTDITTPVSPAPLILIEGILIFDNPLLRDLINLKIYVDVPADIRILRRAKRDIEERGRTLDSVYAQYIATARPMHEKFVEPTKEFADIIIPRGGKNEKAVSTLIHTLEKRLSV
ncbi:uridine kinase [Candidatus Roizmanbacteria bacterium]|nr:MAG: uridine kinase [Candidatus Roizmanbacteria bacterium]